MFHQVFICDTNPDTNLEPEQGILENASEVLKKEIIATESTTMGFIPTEDVKTALEDLKSEGFTEIQNQVTKSDPQVSDASLETKNIVSITPANYPIPPSQAVSQQPQQAGVVQTLDSPNDYNQLFAHSVVPQPQSTIEVTDVHNKLMELTDTSPGAVVSSDLPTVKTEPLVCNMKKKEELEDNQNIATIGVKTESEESTENEDVAEADTPKVHQDAVKECTSSSPGGKEEQNPATVPSHVKYESQPALEEFTSVLSSSGSGEVEQLLGTENCYVQNKSERNLVERTNSSRSGVEQLLVTEKSNVQNENEPTLEKCSGISCSGVEQLSRTETSNVQNESEHILEDYGGSNCSEREENYINDFSGSDWEEQHLNSSSKKNECSKGLAHTAENSTLDNTGLSTFEEHKNGHLEVIELSDDTSGSDWEEEYFKKVSRAKEKSSKGIRKQTLNIVKKQNNQTLRIGNSFQNCEASKSNKKLLKSKKKTKKIHVDLPRDHANYCKIVPVLKPKPTISTPQNVSTLNTVSLTTQPVMKNLSRDNLQTQLNINTQPLQLLRHANLCFVPVNTILSLSNVQIEPSKNILSQVVTVSKTQSRQTLVEVGSNHVEEESNEENANNFKGIFRKILPKPIGAPSNFEFVPSSTSQNTKYEVDPILPKVPYHVYQCKKCNKEFEIVDQFLEHKKRTICGLYKRERKYLCDICGKAFPGTEKLKAHKNSHTNARPYKCSDCDKCFNSKTARYMHFNHMHLNKKVKYLCCFCGYMTVNQEHLKAHEEGHRLPDGVEVPKPFKCLVCGKGFVSNYKLVNHKKEHKLKKCLKCSESFKTNSQLRRHMTAEHDYSKTYDCKECGRKFLNPETLRSHRKTHSSVLSYFCDICDKGFKRMGNLRQHMITHSDHRPISCPECGDRFKRITHLKQHTAAIHGDGRKK